MLKVIRYCSDGRCYREPSPLQSAARSVCPQATDNVGDGCPPTAAKLFVPFGISTDPLGSVYITDSSRIRKAVF